MSEIDPIDRMRELNKKIVDPELWADMHQQIIDFLPDGLLVVDSQGMVKVVNQRLERMFGYNRLHLIGQSFDILLPDETKERHGALFASYFLDPTVRPMHGSRALEGQTAMGSRITVQISLGPLVGQRGIWAMALIRRVDSGP